MQIGIHIAAQANRPRAAARLAVVLHMHRTTRDDKAWRIQRNQNAHTTADFALLRCITLVAWQHICRADSYLVSCLLFRPQGGAL